MSLREVSEFSYMLKPGHCLLSHFLLPLDSDVELLAPSPVNVCLHATMLSAIMIRE